MPESLSLRQRPDSGIPQPSRRSSGGSHTARKPCSLAVRKPCSLAVRKPCKPRLRPLLVSEHHQQNNDFYGWAITPSRCSTASGTCPTPRDLCPWLRPLTSGQADLLHTTRYRHTTHKPDPMAVYSVYSHNTQMLNRDSDVLSRDNDVLSRDRDVLSRDSEVLTSSPGSRCSQSTTPRSERGSHETLNQVTSHTSYDVSGQGSAHSVPDDTTGACVGLGDWFNELTQAGYLGNKDKSHAGYLGNKSQNALHGNKSENACMGRESNPFVSFLENRQEKRPQPVVHYDGNLGLFICANNEVFCGYRGQPTYVVNDVAEVVKINVPVTALVAKDTIQIAMRRMRSGLATTQNTGDSQDSFMTTRPVYYSTSMACDFRRHGHKIQTFSENLSRLTVTWGIATICQDVEGCLVVFPTAFPLLEIPDHALRLQWRSGDKVKAPSLQMVFVLLNRIRKLLCAVRVAENCACVLFKSREEATAVLATLVQTQGPSLLIGDWWYPPTSIETEKEDHCAIWLRHRLAVAMEQPEFSSTESIVSSSLGEVLSRIKQKAIFHARQKSKRWSVGTTEFRTHVRSKSITAAIMRQMRKFDDTQRRSIVQQIA